MMRPGTCSWRMKSRSLVTRPTNLVSVTTRWLPHGASNEKHCPLARVGYVANMSSFSNCIRDDDNGANDKFHLKSGAPIGSLSDQSLKSKYREAYIRYSSQTNHHLISITSEENARKFTDYVIPHGYRATQLYAACSC